MPDARRLHRPYARRHAQNKNENTGWFVVTLTTSLQNSPYTSQDNTQSGLESRNCDWIFCHYTINSSHCSCYSGTAGQPFGISRRFHEQGSVKEGHPLATSAVFRIFAQLDSTLPRKELSRSATFGR